VDNFVQNYLKTLSNGLFFRAFNRLYRKQPPNLNPLNSIAYAVLSVSLLCLYTKMHIN